MIRFHNAGSARKAYNSMSIKKYLETSDKKSLEFLMSDKRDVVLNRDQIILLHKKLGEFIATFETSEEGPMVEGTEF